LLIQIFGPWEKRGENSNIWWCNNHQAKPSWLNH
jgi:hypothetical protein